MLELLLSFDKIYKKWIESGSTLESAKELTISQICALQKIINDDKYWIKLIKIFENGRKLDSWLAQDWPYGFDELVLCVPLCKFVDYDCNKCKVGKRQENNSCSNENTLFGWISVLINENKRSELYEHLEAIKELIRDDGDLVWNLKEHKIEYK